MYFQDDQTVSVSYNNAATPGHAITAISIEGFQVELPTLPVFYSVVRVNSSIELKPNENTIIIDSPTNNEIIYLLSSSHPSVVPGLPYNFILLSGADCTNLLAVQKEDSLNGVVDGTYRLVSQTKQINSLTLISDGNGWFITTPPPPILYSVVRVNSSIELKPEQNTIIVEVATNRETITLPRSSDVAQCVQYKFILLNGADSVNNLAVQKEDSLNGVIDGTYKLTSQIEQTNSLTLISDGNGWFTAP